MHNRLMVDINNWWNSNYNAVKDNGIDGIAMLNRDFNPRTSADTYYFTMSFDATRPFPRFNISVNDLEKVPVHPLLSWGGLLYPGIGNIGANIADGLLNLGHGFPGTPSDVAYAKWAVMVINNQLGNLGYQFRLPSPGDRIPISDMLPVLSIFSIGMSGHSQRLSDENDGVVDTLSMRAPDSGPLRNIGTFDENNIQAPVNRGTYWDLGASEGIDHADQIGVFTDPATVSIAMSTPDVAAGR